MKFQEKVDSKNVLIFIDYRGLRDLYCDLIHKEGFSVEIAMSAHEARLVIEARRIDCVLMGTHEACSNRGSGLATDSFYRETLAPRPDIGVVFVSALPQLMLSLEFRAINCTFLVLPHRNTQVVQAIRDAMTATKSGSSVDRAPTRLVAATNFSL